MSGGPFRGTISAPVDLTRVREWIEASTNNTVTICQNTADGGIAVFLEMKGRPVHELQGDTLEEALASRAEGVKL